MNFLEVRKGERAWKKELRKGKCATGYPLLTPVLNRRGRSDLQKHV